MLGFIWMASTACSDDEPATPIGTLPPSTTGGTNANDWLIPINEVRDGGPGKDGIPSIDNPNFQAAGTYLNLADDELVVAVKNGGTVRAYPHFILDWHEIVNDKVGGLSVAVTYCPLTGTAIGWNRLLDGSETTFGVSGLLYNSNLMPYDRVSNSTWSQMRQDCVNGQLIGTVVKTEKVVELSWSTLRSMYPNAEVLTTETGFNRSYGAYPYGDYRTSFNTIFPVTYDPQNVHPKTRVLGVNGNGASVAYPIDLFTSGTKIILDTIGGKSMVIVGNAIRNFMVAYENELNGEPLDFKPTQSNLEGAIMEDQLGNVWNIFGEVISGPNLLEFLPKTDSYVAFWFAWSAFHGNVEVYKEQ